MYSRCKWCLRWLWNDCSVNTRIYIHGDENAKTKMYSSTPTQHSRGYKSIYRHGLDISCCCWVNRFAIANGWTCRRGIIRSYTCCVYSYWPRRCFDVLTSHNIIFVLRAFLFTLLRNIAIFVPRAARRWTKFFPRFTFTHFIN